MALARTKPLRFSPAGLSDTLAEEDAFPGACAVLQNLVPDPSTKNLWTVRPASILQNAFAAGFTSPTGVTVFKIVGDFVFGLVSVSGGVDTPFCFDLTTQAFVSVTGVTPPSGAITDLVLTNGGTNYGVNNTYPNTPLTGGSGTGATADITVVSQVITIATLNNPGTGYTAGDILNIVSGGTGLILTVAAVDTSGNNLPFTQPTTGEWTPPTMDVMGIFLVVTHPGFDGIENFIGWFDISVLAVPVWHAGNFSLVTPLASIAITNGGTGYIDGSYVNVPLIGGSGAGATANITVAGGIVTVATVANGGLAYAKGNTFTVSGLVIGINGSGVQLTATAVTGSGIAAVIITGPGAGYTNGLYSNLALVGGSGSGATANIGVSSGTVNAVAIVDPGGGYVVGDTLTVEGGAILTFGSITGGSGYTDGSYTNIPILGGSGLGATADITVSGGVVTAVTINQGGAGYKVADVLTISGAGGSVATAQGSSDTLTPTSGTTLNMTSVDITTPTAQGATFNVTFGPGSTGDFVITNIVPVTGGSGYQVSDILQLSPQVSGINWNIQVLTTAVGPEPLGPGTGFSVPVATVTPIPIGNSGTGFTVQVAIVTNPGGFIDFTVIPSWVRQFNGRSWFGINPPGGGIPSVIFSDVFALNATNANQVLSFGDDVPLIAAAPLPLANLLGGIVQSLIIFKSLSGIIQITGDQTTDNLDVNEVPGGSGTLSARSVCNHPQGLLYLDKDGFRIVTLDGNCSDPIGFAGQGVTVPFLNPVNRSRVAAACNGTILRASVQNSIVPGQPWQEYWYDLVRKVWSGPHTFPSIMVDIYEGDFILAPQSAQPSLYRSATAPVASSSYVEAGQALSWIYQTSVLMDNQQMAQSEITETQVKINAVPGLTSIGAAAIDQSGNVLGTALQTLFGQGVGITARQVDFPLPVVYNRLALQFVGASLPGFQIGDAYVRARILGYLQQISATILNMATGLIAGLVVAPPATGIAATDTANLQAAINAAFNNVVGNAPSKAYGQSILFIPGGNYALNAPLRIVSGWGIKIFGAGQDSTSLTNSLGTGLFVTDGCVKGVFQDFTLNGNGSGDTAPLFNLDWINTGSGASLQSNTFRNVSFSNSNIGLSIGTSGNQGSETLIEACGFSGCTVAGVKTCNFNAVANTVIGGNIQGCGIGLWAAQGSINTIDGVSCQLQTGWDIQVDNASLDTYSISGVRTESDNFCHFIRGSASVSGCSQASTAGVFLSGNSDGVFSVDGSICGGVLSKGTTSAQFAISSSQFHAAAATALPNGTSGVIMNSYTGGFLDTSSPSYTLLGSFTGGSITNVTIP